MKSVFYSPRLWRVSLAAVALAFSGCALKTGTVTLASVAQFSFVGQVQDAVVTIDDSSPVTLTETKKGRIVATQPGKHRIRVTRGGSLLVDREVLVTDRQTFEIALP